MPDKTNELIHHGEAQQLYNDLRRRAASADENLAPYYDATQTYAVGDMVMYKDNLYECNTAIATAEAWTAAHWTQRSVADALEESIDKASNVVIISSTQPQGEPNNKIWIKNSTEEEYTIPTYEEFNTIKSALNELDTQINGSQSRTVDATSTAVWTDGKSINSDNGKDLLNEPYSWASIDISGATHVSGYTRAGQDHAQGLAFVGANGTYISGDYHAGASSYDWNYSFDVPTGATALRISCATARKGQFTCFLIFGESDGIIEKLDNLDTQVNGTAGYTEDVSASVVWVSGKSVVAANGTYYSDPNRSAADIPLNGANHVSGYTRAGQENTYGMCFLDANGQWISGDYHAGTSSYDWNFSFDVPSNAATLRISCGTAYIPQFTCVLAYEAIDGLAEVVSDLTESVAENTGEIETLKSETATLTPVGNISNYTWKDGYRVTRYGKDIAVSGYSYATIFLKPLQGGSISGFTRANNDHPAFVFFDSNNRVLGLNYNPSSSEYNYNYELPAPDGATYVKVICSTAYKTSFTISHGGTTLLTALHNSFNTVPQNYRASESVQALKGDKADFNALSQTRLQDIYDWYDNLVSFFPSRLVRTQIGTSSTPTGSYAAIDPNTYPIYAYVWTGKSAKSGNKFILAGGLHGPVDTGGDGIQGVVSMAYFVEDLLFHPDKNEYMQKIYDSCTIVMIPVLNPWGYQAGYRCNGRGVDCNRNFDYNFVPNAESYGYTTGPEAFSENETAALRDYITENHSDAKFFCEIHTRGGAVLPDDARWDFVLNTDGIFTGLLDLLITTGDEMIECYGGTNAWMTHNSENAEPTCYSYFDYVMHIPTYEPEFFRSCNMDEDTLNSRGVQVQCTSWLGSMVQTMADHFCEL